MYFLPTTVKSRFYQINLISLAWTILCIPYITTHRIKIDTKAISYSICIIQVKWMSITKNATITITTTTTSSTTTTTATSSYRFTILSNSKYTTSSIWFYSINIILSFSFFSITRSIYISDRNIEIIIRSNHDSTAIMTGTRYSRKIKKKYRIYQFIIIIITNIH